MVFEAKMVLFSSKSSTYSLFFGQQNMYYFVTFRETDKSTTKHLHYFRLINSRPIFGHRRYSQGTTKPDKTGIILLFYDFASSKVHQYSFYFVTFRKRSNKTGTIFDKVVDLLLYKSPLFARKVQNRGTFHFLRICCFYGFYG